jgi:20S proteasome alpha/beta subunit
MTVCIATRCREPSTGAGVIFGACDRMITSGDITFESRSPNKFIAVTRSIVVMTAGDVALQDEIMREVHNIVTARVQSNPHDWWRVKDVAELYTKHYQSAKAKRASDAILAPLGLDRESFLTRQHELSESFVAQVKSDLLNFQIQSVEAIVTGVDTDGGPHIFVVQDGCIVCCDTIGFAAIGNGSRHAESQFMLNRHAWNSPPSDTVLLTYIAKKRAEIAPSIGSETDMFMIPILGGFDTLNAEAMGKLDEEYKKIVEGEFNLLNQSKEEIRVYIEKFETKPAVQQIQTNTSEQTEGVSPNVIPETSGVDN